jgi:hypothetical protein
MAASGISQLSKLSSSWLGALATEISTITGIPLRCTTAAARLLETTTMP